MLPCASTEQRLWSAAQQNAWPLRSCGQHPRPRTTMSHSGFGAPEFEVWNHLEQAIQNVYNDMENQLSERDIELYEAVASLYLSLRMGLVVNPNDAETPKFLSELTPNAPADLWKNIVLSLDHEPASWNPWFRQAVELQIATKGIGRSVAALDRYVKLRARLADRRVPERAIPYVRQVAESYLFGFDVPVIALACSCFEQLAKVALVAVGEYTDAQIRRERPAAQALLNRLVQRDLLSQNRETAERLIRRRDGILHEGLFDDKVLPQLSLDSVNELVIISIELSPSWRASA